MPHIPVPGPDFIAGHLFQRSQGIGLPCFRGFPVRSGPVSGHPQLQGPGIGRMPPEAGMGPVIGNAVIPGHFSFMLPGDRFIFLRGRAFLDLFCRHIQENVTGFPVHPVDHDRRNQHFVSGQPPPGVCQHVPDRPPLVIEQKIPAGAKILIHCRQPISKDFIRASEHEPPLFSFA